jgi:trans-aconitate 2-methyltransferase
VLGLVGLFVASRAHEEVGYYGGLAFFIFALGLILLQIKRAFDRRERELKSALSGPTPRSASPSWDAALYARYSGERMRPALDLLNRLPQDLRPDCVIDLGCGTGEVTTAHEGALAESRGDRARRAAPMLAKARGPSSTVTWVQADIATWTPERPFDLVFSNAALQWLDGHDVLFPRLMSALSEGGVLAVQIPRNFGAPSHRLMRDTAEESPWRERLRHLLRDEPVMPPARYYDLLAPLAEEIVHLGDGSTCTFWMATLTVLWTGFGGPVCAPILDALTDASTSAEFINRYQQKLAKAYPAPQRRPQPSSLSGACSSSRDAATNRVTRRCASVWF